MLELRQYQKDSVSAVYQHLQTRNDQPCVVIPTAGGKSLVLAQIACDAVLKWGGRVMIMAHVKELLEQNAQKIQAIAPELPLGIYSAGLNSRDTLFPVIVAGIQSVYKRANEFGKIDLALVDEAHLITTEGDGMYRHFLKEMLAVNPTFRIIGLTATDYRMSSGRICKPENLLNHICYEVSVATLIKDGFICNLRSKGSSHSADTGHLHIRGGEFIPKEVEELMNQSGLVGAACREVFERTKDRGSVLIFCSGVEHANHVCEIMNKIAGPGKCETVFGDTLDFDRSRILEDFKNRRLKFLCNVNVLTTGFDAPCIDAIVLLRPTLSPGLYYQMVGRGFRLYDGKKDCLVLDYGGNVARHGPVDYIRIDDKSGRSSAKPQVHECPDCHEIVLDSANTETTCTDCGKKEIKHSATASEDAPLSKDCKPVDTTYSVDEVFYSVHTKRDAPPGAPQTFKVQYKVNGGLKWPTEWICIEHDSFAGEKASAWWRQHSNAPRPKTAAQAVMLSNTIAPTIKITVRQIATEKYDRIINHELGPIPEISDSSEPEVLCPQCGCPDSFEDDNKDIVCVQCGKIIEKYAPFASAEKQVVAMNSVLDIPEDHIPF